MFLVRFAALAATVLMGVVAVTPAQAVSMTQCSTMYQAAQTAGTLNGMKWNDFRKANCGATATPAAAAAPAATTPATPAAKAAATKPAKTPPPPAVNEPTLANTDNATEPPASKAIPPKGVVFPAAIAAKYANETPGKGRMHTCLDQYRADKANNALGGLTWIQAGGGYYSICNTKLKG